MQWPRRRARDLQAGAPSTTVEPRPSELFTARLRLRPLQVEDVDALHRLWSAPTVRRFLWDGHVLGLEQTRDLAMQSAYLFEERGCGLWVALDERQTLVGFCGYWLFREAHELELLYGVDESRWLQGYAREMAAALVSYGFEHLHLEEIRASTDLQNLASQRTLLRLGFIPEAQLANPDKRKFRMPRQRREVGEDGWQAA